MVPLLPESRDAAAVQESGAHASLTYIDEVSEEIKVNFQILLDDLWSDEDDACKDLVSKLLSKNPSGQQPTLHYGAKI